jgi:TPR repeat protein
MALSIQRIIQKASDGDAESQRLLGLMFLDGGEFPRDVNEGFRLLMLAPRQGDPTSMCDVGFCYHTGQGVPFDPSRADDYSQISRTIKLFQRACVMRRGRGREE